MKFIPLLDPIRLSSIFPIINFYILTPLYILYSNAAKVKTDSAPGILHPES